MYEDSFAKITCFFAFITFIIVFIVSLNNSLIIKEIKKDSSNYEIFEDCFKIKNSYYCKEKVEQ